MDPTQSEKASEQKLDRAEPVRTSVSDERLIALFSRPQPAKKLLAGLRELGFSAQAVQAMTGAKSRDVVYSWAAGRAKPGMEQAMRLDEIRRALHFICAHAELGPDSAWMLFNAKFADMDFEGPTAMELIERGRATEVMEQLERLVGDDEDEPGEEGDPVEPSPPADRTKSPLNTSS